MFEPPSGPRVISNSCAEAGLIQAIAAYLQEAVGQRVAAAIAGLVDAKQIGRYAREDGPEPHGASERRLREGYKVVRMLVDGR